MTRCQPRTLHGPFPQRYFRPGSSQGPRAFSSLITALSPLAFHWFFHNYLRSEIAFFIFSHPPDSNVSCFIFVHPFITRPHLSHVLSEDLSPFLSYTPSPLRLAVPSSLCVSLSCCVCYRYNHRKLLCSYHIVWRNRQSIFLVSAWSCPPHRSTLPNKKVRPGLAYPLSRRHPQRQNCRIPRRTKSIGRPTFQTRRPPSVSPRFPVTELTLLIVP